MQRYQRRGRATFLPPPPVATAAADDAWRGGGGPGGQIGGSRPVYGGLRYCSLQFGGLCV